MVWGVRLTSGSQEEQDQDPVDPEEQEGKEGDEGLQGEEGEVDEDFSCHMEQSDGQSHSFPHEEHQQQQDDLRRRRKPDISHRSETTIEQNNPTQNPQVFLKYNKNSDKEKMNDIWTSSRYTYGEDGGGDGVDEQHLSAVPADLHLLLLHFGGCVVSVQLMVDVEPPEDAGPRWTNRDRKRQVEHLHVLMNLFHIWNIYRWVFK